MTILKEILDFPQCFREKKKKAEMIDSLIRTVEFENGQNPCSSVRTALYLID